MNNKIKTLQRAKIEFLLLSKKSYKKATFFKFIDLFIKVIISTGGCVVTYLSDPAVTTNSFMALRICGIIIASLIALSGVFMFEKRTICNIQVHSKCESILTDIDSKIDTLRSNRNLNENINDYIKTILKELSILNLATFIDGAFDKITSERTN
jgi:hypothetical protein